jgi:aspartate racemase
LDPNVRVYAEPLQRRGLTTLHIDAELQEPLDMAIQRLAEGRATPESVGAARAAVEALRAQGVDGIILGCTELPLLLNTDPDAPDTIHPAHLLAEEAVRQALK